MSLESERGRERGREGQGRRYIRERERKLGGRHTQRERERETDREVGVQTTERKKTEILKIGYRYEKFSLV